MEEERKRPTDFSKGLEGVISNTTRIGYVDGVAGKLSYRGYAIEDLAAYSTYEETVCLLLNGNLPTRSELGKFADHLTALRGIPDEVLSRITHLPCPCHPMSLLRSGISLLECIDETCRIADELPEKKEAGIRLIAQMATLTAAIARHREGKEPVAPDPSLPHGANFLYMLRGNRAEPLEERVMDLCLILHADHGMNASTFAAMVVASTLSDLHSAVSAGISTLKGPLHGGANERVIRMLTGIASPAEAETFVEKALAKKTKIMGFGHRVYKTYDPRARILQRYAKELTALTGNKPLFEIARTLEQRVTKAYGEKGIFPNVDFYSGLVYHSLGIEGSLFTPIFAVSRIAGWVARILEYLEDNRLFRPRAVYDGPKDLPYLPIEKRG
ncbi:MAG: citrate synthase [Deltaproteobacteria bacterium]|nr:citrate synthase [Deltaproteobacteria bacterium]